jgi:glycosyltransferase involved in cell wall biosynthesis
LALTKIDKINKYYLYTNKPLDPILLANSNFTEKLIPFPRFWNRFRLPLALLQDKPDIFIELTSSIPPLSPKNTITLVHDLAFKYFPEAYSKYELLLQENAINIARTKAAIIVFTSESNRKDFIKFYGKPKTNTAVIPLAFNNDKVDASQESTKKDYPYFLSVGRIEKRKNTDNIVKAFELFKDNNPTNHKLILVGKNGFDYSKTETAILNSKHKNDIIKKGYVEEKELPLLYKNAEALLYPSLYEGFGLPAMEAMSHGTPVITSNVPTIREVVKDAALLVDPQNVDDIVKAMKNIVFEKELRKSLVLKGFQISKEYSWDKTAGEFYKLIMELCKKDENSNRS